MSEGQLIQLIQDTVRSRGRVRLSIGDDAAVLGDGTVVTTDAYADGAHFDLSYMTLRQVGERCACGAISDVVAMAAEPEAMFVSLALPRDSGRLVSDRRLRRGGLRAAVRSLYGGIESVCKDMGCEVAGGDVIVADRLLLALTVTGRTRTPRLRSGAMLGDRLYVTGHLGSAEAGRMVLAEQARSRRQGAMGQGEERRLMRGDWRLPLVGRHLRPMPRLAVTRALKSRIHGLIDTSDGLATDAGHLSEMSRVKIVLEPDKLPVLPGTTRLCTERGLDPLVFVLGAGEDYELLFTSPYKLIRAVDGVKVTGIGRVENGAGLWIARAGRVQPVTVSGYDHLVVDRDNE
jgi:thiamine-monophosphate kinase